MGLTVLIYLNRTIHSLSFPCMSTGLHNKELFFTSSLFDSTAPMHLIMCWQETLFRNLQLSAGQLECFTINWRCMRTIHWPCLHGAHEAGYEASSSTELRCSIPSFYPKYIHAVTLSITIRLQCSLKTLCSQLQLYIKFHALDPYILLIYMHLFCTGVFIGNEIGHAISHADWWCL